MEINIYNQLHFFVKIMSGDLLNKKNFKTYFLNEYYKMFRKADLINLETSGYSFVAPSDGLVFNIYQTYVSNQNYLEEFLPILKLFFNKVKMLEQDMCIPIHKELCVSHTIDCDQFGHDIALSVLKLACEYGYSLEISGERK